MLTPHQIVAELNKYIIGQNDAKRQVAIALRNRWRRMNSHSDMQKEIVPNNILMIGSTGVGKTEIARRLAKLTNAPFIKVEASKYTEVGYVGRDVESMVRDLTEQAFKQVKAEMKENVAAKAMDLAEEKILDALIPPIKDESSAEASDALLNEGTREKYRLKIRNRELEDRKIEIELPAKSSPIIGIEAFDLNQGMDVAQFSEAMESMFNRKVKKRKVSISEARKLIAELEANRLIDLEEVKEEAVARVENTGIIFIDEIDKIANSSSRGSGEVSREGVQRDLLPIVEGSAVNTKHGLVNTDHILFIAAGAFHVSRPSDLIPELQGRFPIRVELKPLEEEDFYQILKTPQNSLTRQYEALLRSENVALHFEDDALKAIAKIAFDTNAEIENIGARRLQTILSTLLAEYLFDIPDTIGADSEIRITASLVQAKLGALSKNKDLSRYIL